MTKLTLESTTELVKKASSIVPRLRERAKETDEIGRIPETTIKELKEAGLFHILRSKGLAVIKQI